MIGTHKAHAPVACAMEGAMKILLISTMLSFCVTAVAADPPPPQNVAKPVADAAHRSDMRVYMDPKTGELAQSPVAPEPPAAKRHVDLSKIVEIRHADGSIETQFNGQADSALVAEAAADGSVHYRCAGHAEVHAHDNAAQESHDE
jgi:hypothetical protein